MFISFRPLRREWGQNMAVGIEFEFFHAALPDVENRFLVSASFVSVAKSTPVSSPFAYYSYWISCLSLSVKLNRFDWQRMISVSSWFFASIFLYDSIRGEMLWCYEPRCYTFSQLVWKTTASQVERQMDSTSLKGAQFPRFKFIRLASPQTPGHQCP